MSRRARPGSYRVALFTGPGEPLKTRSYSPPTLGPDEALVRVRACTLCGSDLHSYFGRRPTPCPTVLGHEIVGEVLELPTNKSLVDYVGDDLRIGDRISWNVTSHCGTCPRCLGGLPQKCPSLFKYGHQRFDEAAPFAGGLADVCRVRRGTTICRVPERLADEVAALANCAGATAAAALRIAGSVRDRAVLVQGAGTLGLLACAMARRQGARSILVTDTNPDRLELAKRFGATMIALAGEPGVREAVRRTGAGFDVALEMSGAPEALETAIPNLSLGAVCMLVGGALPSRAAGIPMEAVVRNLLTIRGVHNYWPVDLHTALSFLDGSYDSHPFGDLIGERFELEDCDEAFRCAETGHSCRVAVVPCPSD